MIVVLLLINIAAALLILVRGMFFAINRMDRCTPHGMRLAWLGITTGALGIIVGPLYGIHPNFWQTALVVGIALYVLFDRRRDSKCDWRKP